MSTPTNNNRITELMLAASRGDLARLEALLEAGVDPNALLRPDGT
jgi:ankyrin repeat protein